jgi:hypothetical protein
VFRRLLSVAALVGALSGWLVLAQPAAAGLTPAVADCNQHANLTHAYTAAQLTRALATMPADIREYTDCYDVIQRALLAALPRHGGGGSGGGGGSFLPTPVLIILVLLGLSGVSFGVIAVRRRLSSGPPDAD